MRLTIDQDDLRNIIDSAVTEAIDRFAESRILRDNRMAYTESEATAMMGVRDHVLRDARLRGEVAGARVGKRIVYAHDELMRFLRARSQVK